jgi:hypothetical protein
MRVTFNPLILVQAEMLFKSSIYIYDLYGRIPQPEHIRDNE